MKKLLLSLLALASAMVPASAPGQNSSTILVARRAGLIGERFDGYLGIVNPGASAEVRRQVGAINIRRRSLYSNLAARKGVSPEEVGITAACSLLRRIGVGEYYLLNQGGWQRVAPGQSPVPSYCV
ncbi:MAG TPA: YdbL family protein [Sphingomicrobium sp.]